MSRHRPSLIGPGSVLSAGDEIWTPDARLRAEASLSRFMGWARERGAYDGTTYQDLWRWSAEDVGRFWLCLFEFEKVIADESPTVGLAGDSVEDAIWFPATRLNYAEHVFRDRASEAVALICVDEELSYEVSWAELEHRVAQLAHTLRRMGVRQGDRVAGYLPNAEAAVVGLLATASIGAIWSVCSPTWAQTVSSAESDFSSRQFSFLSMAIATGDDLMTGASKCARFSSPFRRCVTSSGLTSSAFRFRRQRFGRLPGH